MHDDATIRDPRLQPIYLISREVKHREGGISDTTLWRWIRAGRFPAPVYTPGGHRRWLLSDIQAWEANLATAREAAR